MNQTDINSAIPDLKKLFNELKYAPSFIYDGSKDYNLVRNPYIAKCLNELENLSLTAKKAFVEEYCSFSG